MRVESDEAATRLKLYLEAVHVLNEVMEIRAHLHPGRASIDTVRYEYLVTAGRKYSQPSCNTLC